MPLVPESDALEHRRRAVAVAGSLRVGTRSDDVAGTPDSAQRAIDEAISRFGKSESQLHQRARKALRDLRANHQSVTGLFASRGEERTANAERTGRESIDAARAHLSEVEVSSRRLSALNDEDLNKIADADLELARLSV